jgi:transaldolase/glucose-6-phosphate isomerase
MSRIAAIHSFGQSIWLDYIRRDLLQDGGLKRLIDEDGIAGLTSNPAIFEKAIAGSHLYDVSIAGLVAAGESSPARIAEALAVQDIRTAAQQLLGCYQRSQCTDGYVSLEVAPDLANDTEATVAEGRRLWLAVGAPNLMIKVPATAAGINAIRALTAEGINVNVTLLFNRTMAEAVALAYTAGLEDYRDRGGDVSRMASVASFFISRIDAALEPILHDLGADSLQAKVAIANAQLAYQEALARNRSPRWQALAAQGAQPQRLLWASTGTKSKTLRDTLYVEALIGPDTVNTVPPATLDAFRDHGEAAATLDADPAAAARTMAELSALPVNLEPITERLLADGLKLFEDAHKQLLAAVAAKVVELRA